MPEDYASQFMLQEYTRIIDAYHDLHRQKDALIKFYLAFVSLPLSVVAIFLALSRFFQTIPQVGAAAPAQTGNILQALQAGEIAEAENAIIVRARELFQKTGGDVDAEREESDEVLYTLQAFRSVLGNMAA